METLLQQFRNLGPVKLSAIGGFLIFIIIAIILLSLRSAVSEFVPLYANLDMKDSNKIVTELESKNVPYQLKMNGSEILVPSDKVLKLRMSMASQGYPSSGSIVGYEIFDNSELLGTSSFVQNVNLVRALEGELSRTIASLANIESARVHLVMPKREIFSREKELPSASIVVGIKGNNTLTKDQINAISNMVATAVPELDLSRITIVDSKGRSLKLGAKNKNDLSTILSNNEEIRVAYELRLKTTIEELLEQSLGLGHIKAQVSADMNFDRIVTNSEIYDPAGQVVRSIQEVDDKEAAVEKEPGSVTVSGNIPNVTNPDNRAEQNSSNSSHNDTTTNYEISKTVKNQISETGVLKKLSIAVLIDGIYKIDKATGEASYIGRDDIELKKYENLIKSAVGFDSNRGDIIEVINMQFTNDLSILKGEAPLDWIKRELPSLLQTLIIGTVVVLVLLLIVRPIAIRAFESAKVELDELDSDNPPQDMIDNKSESTPDLEQTGEQSINIAEIEARFKSNNNLKLVNDVADKYPQETVSALRKWMNKE